MIFMDGLLGGLVFQFSFISPSVDSNCPSLDSSTAQPGPGLFMSANFGSWPMQQKGTGWGCFVAWSEWGGCN